MSIVLGFLLVVSLIVNGVLCWYIYNFFSVIKQYNQELKSVLEDLYFNLYQTYQAVDYYGDPEIRRLLVHCREVGKFLIEFLEEIMPDDQLLRQDLQFFNQLIDSEDDVDAQGEEE